VDAADPPTAHRAGRGDLPRGCGGSAAGRRAQPPSVRPQGRAAIRPPGVAGALVVVTIGAILTYAVSFTVSGVSIHAVGVIIMLVGAVALAILLIRSVGWLRLRDQPRRRPGSPVPDPGGSYLQDHRGGVPPIAATNQTTSEPHLDRVLADTRTTAQSAAGRHDNPPDA
jgi:hypothetical protein